MNKFVFIDLDETLIHTLYNCFSNNRVRVDFSSYIGGRSDMTPTGYGVLLRPNTHEFLKTVRGLYPNVYMLTAATSEYGQKMNDVFNLGFTSEEIIGRDLWNAIYANSPKLHRFTNDPCYSVLIDNEHPKDKNACDKINYLKTFGKAYYIRIKGYYGSDKDELTESIINDLVNDAKEGFIKMHTNQ